MKDREKFLSCANEVAASVCCANAKEDAWTHDFASRVASLADEKYGLNQAADSCTHRAFREALSLFFYNNTDHA